MASALKKAQQLARKLYKLSFENGRLSAERVAGVLGYVEKTQPANPVAVLKAYRRLVAAEVARNEALVEHAGSISPTLLSQIAAVLSKKYNRPVTASAQANPDLLAGLRIRIGDDIYENSVAGQLSALAEAV